MEERGSALSLVLHERASVNRGAPSGLNRTPSGFFLQAMSEQGSAGFPQKQTEFALRSGFRLQPPKKE